MNAFSDASMIHYKIILIYYPCKSFKANSDIYVVHRSNAHLFHY